jgi:hypothetical protein
MSARLAAGLCTQENLVAFGAITARAETATQQEPRTCAEVNVY